MTCHCDIRLGPAEPAAPTPAELKRFTDEIMRRLKQIKERRSMHYRNGREAKNGDKIIRLNGGKVEAYGVLHSASPTGGDACNGNIAIVQSATEYACLCDCLHIDDVAAMLKEKGLDKRPAGK